MASNSAVSNGTSVAASDSVPAVLSSASNSQSNILSAPVSTTSAISNATGSGFVTKSVVNTLSLTSAVSTTPKSATSLAATSSVAGIASKINSASTGLTSASISHSDITSTFATVSSREPIDVTDAVSSSPSLSSSSVVAKSTPLVTNPSSSSTPSVTHSSTPLSSAAPAQATAPVKPSSSAISSTSSSFVSSSESSSTKLPSISLTTVDQTHASTTIIVMTSVPKISAPVTSSAVKPQVSQPSPAESISSRPSSTVSQPPQATATTSFASQSSSNSRASLEGALETGNAGSSTNLGSSVTGLTFALTSDHADSTFSAPVSVTTTDSSGSTIITTPAFITSFSVSSASGGLGPQTFTSIIANPTSIVSAGSLSNWTFWDNRGAVAGVFIAVALAIMASVLGTFYCCRRRRRIFTRAISTTGSRFRQDMLEQPTTYQAVVNDPQRPLMAPSIMSGGTSVGHDDATIQRTNSLHSSDVHTGALGLSGMPVNPRKIEHAYEGPFSDYHRYNPMTSDSRSVIPGEWPVGTTFSSYPMSDSSAEHTATSATVGRPPSPAPSSPSIYPPSLPAVPEKDEDDFLFYEREIQRRPLPQLPIPPPKAFIDDANSQNPFSSAFDSKMAVTAERELFLTRIQTGQVYQPLTPPDSSLGHSSLPSPVTPRSSEAESVKPNPFSNTFLGRPVSMKIEPLPRPKRSPLRLSASGSSLKD